MRAYPIVATGPLLAALALSAPDAWAQEPELGFAPLTLEQDVYRFATAEGFDIEVDVVLRGLDHPFSLAFLPDGDALITERGKTIRLVHDATGRARLDPAPVSGGPEPGQARGTGVTEIAAHPEFGNNRLVYFSDNRAGTLPSDAAEDARPPVSLIVSRGTLTDGTIRDTEIVLDAGPRAGSSGSRLAFDGAGMLYISTGAPFGPEAQDVSSVYGKVLRVHDDGRIPVDNPYAATPGARGEIWSLGHRDQLGLTVHPDGVVFAAEHGPNGGDEVNLILPGRDYGWPAFSFGRNYDGPRISARPLGDDTEQPTVLWIPSIGITGLAFYTADRLPAWRGNLFVGSARRGQIPGTGGLERVVVNENFEELRRESLLGPLRQRIRDVRQGPDGLLYVLTDEDDGALLRVRGVWGQ